MKNALLVVIWIFVLACNTPLAEAQTVYVTKTGEKYHLNDCRYLKYSKVPVSLKDAKTRGYTPCSVCKPGTTVTAKDSTSTPNLHKPVPSQGGKSQVATQCTALTQSGLRCKRTTTNTNGRCWQHQ